MNTWEILKSQIYALRKNGDSPTDYRPYQYHLQYLNFRLNKYFINGRNHINDLISEMEEFESNKPEIKSV